MSPKIVINALVDFTQFVGPDGLALDTESLNQILQVFGVGDENMLIQQAVCTLTAFDGHQLNISEGSQLYDNDIQPEDIVTYISSLPPLPAIVVIS